MSILREINEGIKQLVHRFDQFAQAKSAKPKTKKESSPVYFWKEMVAHIDETWKRKKGSPYPFTDRDFKQLKPVAKLYMTWGVMSLWDCFIASDDPFFRQTGYKIGAFIQSLPKLLDMSWKPRAEVYRNKLEAPAPSLTNLIAGLSNEKKLQI